MKKICRVKTAFLLLVIFCAVAAKAQHNELPPFRMEQANNQVFKAGQLPLEMYPAGTCKSWYSSTTFQRRLSLEKVNDAFLIASNPVKELDKPKGNIKKFPNIIVN